MRAALAAAFLLVSQTAPAGTFYDFEWRSAAMLSRWEGGDTVTTRGELAGGCGSRGCRTAACASRSGA